MGLRAAGYELSLAKDIRTYFMPRSFNRREVISKLMLIVSTPCFATQDPDNALQRTSTFSQQLLAKISPISDQFVSVDGWVLPTQTLTHGEG